MKRLAVAAFILAIIVPAVSSAGIIGKPANNLGLVGYWSFNEGSGTTAGDSSGRRNTGAITNAPWVSGKFGKALDFDGNDIVSVSENSGLPLYSTDTTYSYAMWIKGPPQTNGNFFIEDNSSGNAMVALSSDSAASSGKFEIFVFSDSGATMLDAKTNSLPLDNTWHHIVWSDNNGTATLYIDGVPDAGSFNYDRDGASNDQTYTMNRLSIGAFGGGGFAYTGLIDDVRMYNRVLSAAEVQALYRSGAASVGSSATLGSGTLRNGLVGHWTMDGADVTDKVYDKSGQGKNGYYYGRATSSAKVFGKLGQALSFNGTSDYVATVTNAGVTNTTPFTIAGWFYSTAATNDQVMIGTGIDTAPYDGVWLQWGSSSPCGAANILTFVIVSSSATEEGICSSTTLSQNRWYHITASYDGSQTIAGMKFYIDGTPESVGTQANNGFGAFTDRPWRLGKDSHTNPSTYFIGKMDDVRIYNRVLSASEVKQLYNFGGQKVAASSQTLTNGSSLARDLVGYWTFDGADITSSIADKSGNGRVGYFYASATSTAKVAGKLGQALRFDGSTNYVDVGSISITGAITLSAWVKFSDLNCSSGCDIVANYNAAGDTAQYEMSMVNGEIGYSSASGGSFPGGTTNTTPITQTNRWYHLVVTRNATAVRTADTVSVYVDGVPQTGSFTTATPPGASFGRTAIGRDGELNDPQFNFPGIIDDVRIYTRDLSAAEVKQLYNLGK